MGLNAVFMYFLLDVPLNHRYLLCYPPEQNSQPLAELCGERTRALQFSILGGWARHFGRLRLFGASCSYPAIALRSPFTVLLGPAGQTPSVLGGVRVIHSQQFCLCSSYRIITLCLAAVMIHLLLVIGLFCDESNISEADI